jgi:hypothetical protein
MNRDPRFALSQELEAKQMAPQKRLLPNRRQSEAQAPAHSIRRRRGCSVARRDVRACSSVCKASPNSKTAPLSWPVSWVRLSISTRHAADAAAGAGLKLAEFKLSLFDFLPI